MTVPLKGALVIPQKATFEILEKKCVFVVDKTNVVHQREIGITSEMPGLYVIKSGITGTDWILLDGLRKVKDGDKINYDYKAPESVPSHLGVCSEYKLRVNACQTVMPSAAETLRAQHYSILGNCMVPKDSGVTLGAAFKVDLWKKYHMAAPVQRRQLGSLSNKVQKAYKS